MERILTEEQISGWVLYFFFDLIFYFSIEKYLFSQWFALRRGCGFISLENLLFFARTYPVRHLTFFLLKRIIFVIILSPCVFDVFVISELIWKEELLIFTNYVKFKIKASFRRLLFKQDGKRATWEYPFAVAGINVSFMLIQMLDLYSGIQRVHVQSIWESITFAIISSYVQLHLVQTFIFPPPKEINVCCSRTLFSACIHCSQTKMHSRNQLHEIIRR